MSIGNFLESLSQAILVGIILAGRLGGMRPHVATKVSEPGSCYQQREPSFDDTI